MTKMFFCERQEYMATGNIYKIITKLYKQVVRKQ